MATTSAHNGVAHATGGGEPCATTATIAAANGTSAHGESTLCIETHGKSDLSMPGRDAVVNDSGAQMAVKKSTSESSTECHEPSGEPIQTCNADTTDDAKPPGAVSYTVCCFI